MNRQRNHFSILNYNIHKGFSWNNRNFILEKIREIFRTLRPDLIFLQEIVGEHQLHAKNVKDWPTESQLEYLADTFWTDYAYAKNAVYPEGHHGNAILSRFPIKSWKNENISTNSLESRGLLHCCIEISKDVQLHALCTHLNLLHQGRKLQYQYLIQYVENNIPPEAPLVLAGDFNDWNRKASATLESGLGVTEAFHTNLGGFALTFPAFFPVFPLDRIYVRYCDVQRCAIYQPKITRKISDHLPLYVEVTM